MDKNQLLTALADLTSDQLLDLWIESKDTEKRKQRETEQQDQGIKDAIKNHRIRR